MKMSQINEATIPQGKTAFTKSKQPGPTDIDMATLHKLRKMLDKEKTPKAKAVVGEAGGEQIFLDFSKELTDVERTEDTEVFTAKLSGLGFRARSEEEIDLEGIPVNVTINATGDVQEGEFEIVSVTGDDGTQYVLDETDTWDIYNLTELFSNALATMEDAVDSVTLKDLEGYDQQTASVAADIKAKYPNAPDALSAVLGFIADIRDASKRDEAQTDKDLEHKKKHINDVEQRIYDLEKSDTPNKTTNKPDDLK